MDGHRYLLDRKNKSKSVSKDNSSSKIKGKESAPGQSKKKTKKEKEDKKKKKKRKEKDDKETNQNKTKGKNENKGKGKATAPGQIWKETGVHPKLIAASPNAAFKRDPMRDPDNNVYDAWEEWKEDKDSYEIFPEPKPTSEPSSGPPSSSTPAPIDDLHSSQKRRAESLTNVFEFATVSPQYGYAENIGDNRGITFGRAGFCTGTGDGLMVVEDYTRRKPNNKLAEYLPALRRIDREKKGETNGDTSGLEGFIKTVRSLEDDQDFRKAQDWVWKQLYFNPSQRAADQLGLQLPLSRAQLYDAYLMHGENKPSDDFYPKSANGIAAWVNKELNGSPADGVDEKKWIRSFFARRTQILKNTDNVWSKATNRIEIYQWLANANIWKLDRTIELTMDACGKDGVCSKSSSRVVIGPSVYGNLRIP